MENLTASLGLPEDVVLGSLKLSVTAGKRALVENHRGVLSFSDTQVIIAAKRGQLAIEGTELSIMAMTKSQILISGKIQTVEWQ
ncbi:MAG: YabP/YqfC family sporulation protein [Candidatus Limivicinus sp.]|jgi:sporulation protein YqfC